MSKRTEELYPLVHYGEGGWNNMEAVDNENYIRLSKRAAYEQAEKDLGWISVKDRLPDTTDYMFTCINDHGIPQCVGFHYYKDGKWWEGYEEDAVSAVEYWMSIPKLPEK